MIVYYRQSPNAAAEEFVNVKELIENTVVDLDDIANEENLGTLGLPLLISERGSPDQEISVLRDCRAICLSFRELVDQMETVQCSESMNGAHLKQNTKNVPGLLSEIHSEPVSTHLSAYFEALKDGSRKWNTDTLIEGIEYLVNVIGPERHKYFENALAGLHYPPSFAELWNQIYPQQRIDSLFFAACPPGWSSDIEDCCLDLAYREGKSASQGLNRFLRGPTTLDCGMGCQIFILMGIRFMVGDDLFDRWCRFELGILAIRQQCYKPASPLNKVGNPLFYFFDMPVPDDTRNTLGSQARIRMRAFFNHRRYLAKHPKGTARLENVIQIDNNCILFRPGAAQSILSEEELEISFLKAYNAPRTLADEAEIRFYMQNPEKMHPYLKKTFGSLADEAQHFRDHCLTDSEWRDTIDDRKKMAHGYHLVLNFERLVSSLMKVR
ncbi:hypothetical protein N7540_011021 [Penicillium herquei]|nr:hypothetical protein N7540_011021 [Penicillium herquei]